MPARRYTGMSPLRNLTGYIGDNRAREEKSPVTKEVTLPRPRVYPAGSGGERSLYAAGSAEESGRCFSRPACTAGPPASLTVEAALICSMFFLFMYIVWLLFPVMQLQTELQSAMEETGGRIAVSAPLLQMTESSEREEGTDALPAGIAKEAVFAAYAKKKILDNTDSALWDIAHVKGGRKGLNMSGSRFEIAGDVFLQASYKVQLPGLFGKLITIPLCQTSRRKCWTGKTGNAPEDAGGENDVIVYVADTGSVYHKDPGCYHLNVTVRSVSAGAVGAARNSGGGRYKPCEHCAAAADAGSIVFITPEGDRYHVTRDCSGLKRSLRCVPLSECGLPPCSNCGK